MCITPKTVDKVLFRLTGIVTNLDTMDILFSWVLYTSINII